MSFGGSNPPSPTRFAPPRQTDELRAQAGTAGGGCDQPEAPDHDPTASLLRGRIRQRQQGARESGWTRQNRDRADRATRLGSSRRGSYGGGRVARGSGGPPSQRRCPERQGED